ncbi:acetyl-CoA C-acyltransferase [uncultured Schumannella sp.]|uniref:acetyl-CoA C-acyltransferase n=1 Tax=uncultured Schumannella sp. TaxID=1195956 RepID=UPI0025D7D9C9|nr:acetyl-CoA C-acyltransferase [uncultured Schumannella sp.]
MSAVIAGYARTPFVRYLGALASVPATTLGGHAAAAAITRAGLSPHDIDHVFAGQVLQAGAGQNPARQSAIAAGLSYDVPAQTLNVVCLSGLEAVTAAARLIATGEARIVVAIGQESMSLAPHVLPGSRTGTRYGAIELLDTMEHDGLTDAFESRSMGLSTEERNPGLSITREQQDAVAAASHQRLAASTEFLAEEIAPFEVTSRRGSTTVDTDDGLRADTTVESLGQLRPAFSKDGTITAGNSSQISDGAAAIVVMHEDEARIRGIHPLARILAHAFVAGPDVSLHSQPARAIESALARTEFAADELAAIEINEAFAAVAVQSTRVLDVDPALVNAHGGAIALGHPIGASGTRIVGHLARRLGAVGTGSVGAAGICGGGGQGSAIILEAL